ATRRKQVRERQAFGLRVGSECVDVAVDLVPVAPLKRQLDGVAVEPEMVVADAAAGQDRRALAQRRRPRRRVISRSGENTERERAAEAGAGVAGQRDRLLGQRTGLVPAVED